VEHLKHTAAQQLTLYAKRAPAAIPYASTVAVTYTCGYAEYLRT
jgi:hypothetical protein